MPGPSLLTKARPSCRQPHLSPDQIMILTLVHASSIIPLLAVHTTCDSWLCVQCYRMGGAQRCVCVVLVCR